MNTPASKTMTTPKKTASRPPKPSVTSQKATTIEEWMTQQSQQDLLRFIACGSVDDGKSTLIGRLLWESQQIFDDQLSALQADSKRHGTQGQDIDFALLVDGLAAEREQGITIDVAYRFFSTPRRKFIVADTPGHEQYTRNMITGASTADVAVLLIDARQGVLTQTRRHAYLVSLVGIKQVVLAINKMDLVNYQASVFDTIVAEFRAMAQSLAFESVTAIPLSALKGENITSRSAHTPWYPGPTLMGCLETLRVKRTTQHQTVFPVQWVNRPNASFRGFSGTLASGHLKVGDRLRVTASGQTAALTKIVTADGDRKQAQAGDAVTLVLDREVDASRGDVIALAEQPLEMTDQFEATLVWMHDEPGLMGRTYELKLANQWAGASITNLKYRVDVNTQAQESSKQLALNDIAVGNLALSKPLVFAPYTDNPTLGGFVLVDKFTYATVAAGMIRHNLRRAQNVHRQALSITREDRERLNGHNGKVIWFTGLSGSGKSTLANALEKELYAQGRRTYILDGDNIRQGLNKDLGFTDADRVENIRRVAEVARLMMDAGLIVMTAFISPFRAEREMARELIGAENFIEVFVDTPLAVCEQRDPKGLYKKARSGQLPNMTGISSAYERPLAPAFVVSHDEGNMQASVRSLMEFLSPH
jgi:bifunctional enzyme CysN/CysC